MKVVQSKSKSEVVFKRSASCSSRTVNCSEVRQKKSTIFSFHKNLDFLQKHNKVFSKPLYNSGDADTYFRNILRNYDEGDLFEDLSWLKQSLGRSAKSTNCIVNQKNKSKAAGSILDVKNKKVKSTPKLSTERKQESKQINRNQVYKKTKALTERKHVNLFSENPDDLLDVFYSPRSDTTIVPEDLSQTNLIDQEELLNTNSDVERLSFYKMADEEEEPPTPVEDAVNDVTEDDEEMQDAQDTTLADSPVAEEPPDTPVVEDEPPQTEPEKPEESELKDQAKPDEKIGGDGSTFKFDSAIDSAVLKELEEAEKQAKKIANIIYELKNRMNELLKKEKMTEQEAKELEQKNIELKQQMMLFEEETKRIQCLIQQSNLFESLILPKPPRQTKHAEDALPKVIVCGLTENDMPKILVCDSKKLKCPKKQTCGEGSISTPMEKLARGNADLEGMRYRRQSDVPNKDQTIENLQKQLCCLQSEVQMICRENACLNEKLQQQSNPQQAQPQNQCGSPQNINNNQWQQQQQQQQQQMSQCQQNQRPQSCPQTLRSDQHSSSCGKSAPKGPSCGKSKPCPVEIENRLNVYSNTTQQLEKQLREMETDVKNMQNEIVAVQTERECLELHRKMLYCVPPTPPCAPSPCPPKHSCSASYTSNKTNGDQQLRELREQYNRLQDDFKSKLTEVAGLRADNEQLKKAAKKAEEHRMNAEEKLKEFEKDLRGMKNDKNKSVGSKEELIEQTQQLIVAKQRFREAQDELDEVRTLIEDLQAQLDDYRNKYLMSQQEVEEQRRQIDMMDMENNRVSEQVNFEIQRVKNQFQEKLQELTPLPDILKSTQLKLQEAQQMHALAERNNEALTQELQTYKDKVSDINNQMDQVRSDQQLGEDAKMSLGAQLEEWESKYNQLQEEHDDLEDKYKEAKELAEENEKKADTKLHEIAQLSAQLESVREESARQVSRTKDRCETIRRSMQNQITDLERQLVQSRAQAKAAQKDRDDIRLKMQSQITNLNENFDDAQMRIRSLQGHVNFLKPSSGDNNQNDMEADVVDPCACGNNM